MVVATDIRLYDPKDMEIVVENTVVEEPAGFEAAAQFSDELGLIETLQGEIGFNVMRASTKGSIRVRMKLTSPTRNYMDQLAQNRTIVKVSVRVVANQARYPFREVGLAYAIFRPSTTPIERQNPDIEYEAIGFQFFITPNT